MGGRRLAVHVLDTRIEIVLHGRDTDELFARAEEAWSLALAPTTDVDAVVVAELLPEGDSAITGPWVGSPSRANRGLSQSQTQGAC
ncbi:hypothetical protein [Ornithinimicrobium sp. INDO-MA30-4]|uniref:hypothetical protein n=1 Tax=Ornithinimicrobium sp. INDO-MA30-4 TaxID=2908651 RepID=UPI001F24F18E|nr:hypothetical protein [Ornithinimicrobium sp. INDO-MA30-4]UJH70239.1 hypothetical protein L0A91_13915 [Ornithinimicrobium sp. INDO-MA30-4]